MTIEVEERLGREGGRRRLVEEGVWESAGRRFVRMRRVTLMKSILEIEKGEGIMILEARRVVMLDVRDGRRSRQLRDTLRRDWS